MKTSIILFCLSLCFHALYAAGNKVIVGYFPNSLNGTVSVSKVDVSKYTHINYAFALMVEGHIPTWEKGSSVKKELPKLVSAAHKQGTKMLTSIGGWIGSITFSSMAGNTTSRKEFIDWCVDHMKKYNTDGIDIDWEYPGRQGAGCNEVNEDKDIDNFLVLLQELRKAMDKELNAKELTIAAHVNPLKANMSDFAKVLDRINIMTYDLNGAWNEQTAPNSPLYAADGALSFSSSVESWINAGVSASKLTGGVAYYGRSTTAKQNMLKTKSINQDQVKGTAPKGDSLDKKESDPYCAADNGVYSGTWRFNRLISQGILSTPLKAKKPWVRTWDNSTATPWLFNPKTDIFISYDDPQSIQKKACYAFDKGLAGLMVWAIDQDTSNNDLVNAAHNTGKC
ncbi:unnamed protein product [Rhizopus stolonifer]